MLQSSVVVHRGRKSLGKPRRQGVEGDIAPQQEKFLIHTQFSA
jgi:hypothetical protein